MGFTESKFVRTAMSASDIAQLMGFLTAIHNRWTKAEMIEPSEVMAAIQIGCIYGEARRPADQSSLP
jgi:hypothetical protein